MENNTSIIKNTPTSLAGPNKVSGGSELLDAHAILTQYLEIKPGNIVADLGAGGAAYFTMQAARLVGQNGLVYAVDVVKTVLSGIESKAQMAGLYNIKTIWSNLEILGAAKIPETSVDFAFLINILFQTKKKNEVINEAIRLLKPGGSLLIVDWNDSALSFAPPAQLRVNPEEIIRHAEKMSLTLKKSFDAGNHHFGLIFVK